MGGSGTADKNHRWAVRSEVVRNIRDHLTGQDAGRRAELVRNRIRAIGGKRALALAIGHGIHRRLIRKTLVGQDVGDAESQDALTPGSDWQPCVRICGGHGEAGTGMDVRPPAPAISPAELAVRLVVVDGRKP